MLSVAMRIMSNLEDVRECVPDAFVQAFKIIDRFEGRSFDWTWLHRIDVQSALLKRRSQSRRPEGLLHDIRERIVAQMYEPFHQDEACAP